MEFLTYGLFIMVIAIIVVVAYVFFLRKRRPKITTALTTLRSTNLPYTVTKDTIGTMNNNISMSNYAISVWQYIDLWTNTSSLKNIVNVPDVINLSMGESTNELVITMYSGLSTGSTSTVSTSTVSTSTVSPSTVSPSTESSTVASSLFSSFGSSSIFSPPPSVSSSRVVSSVITSIDFKNLVADTVYRYNNTYIFVYKSYANPSTKSVWKQVRVGFSSTQLNTRVYNQVLKFGGSYNSLLLENNGQIASNVKSSLAECPKWTWTCTARPYLDKCSPSTPVTICEPTVSTPLITPYPKTTEKSGLTAAVYTITDNHGEHFFTDGQYFTFLYYGVGEEPTVTSPTNQVQIYPKILESIGGMYDPFIESSIESIYPKAQPTPSSLLSPLEDNSIGTNQVTEGMYESLTSTIKSTSYRVPNMPLQTWTHVLINVTGRNVTVYINGQIRTAYITPDIPNQMNQMIQLTNSPTFTGWTSQLNYIPFGVSSEEAQQIYSNGYLGKSYQSSGGWWGFFNRYSLKVVFVDNLGI